jgi:hypothetical protein
MRAATTDRERRRRRRRRVAAARSRGRLALAAVVAGVSHWLLLFDELKAHVRYRERLPCRANRAGSVRQRATKLARRAVSIDASRSARNSPKVTARGARHVVARRWQDLVAADRMSCRSAS